MCYSTYPLATISSDVRAMSRLTQSMKLIFKDQLPMLPLMQLHLRAGQGLWKQMALPVQPGYRAAGRF